MANTQPTARYLAVKIIKGVIDQHKSLTALLELYQQQLPVQQQPMLSQLCYGAVRWYIQLAFWLSQLMHKPLRAKDREVHFIILLGLYQLAYMDKPKHAVLSTSVDLSREFDKSWASGLINGVLRNFVRQQNDLKELSNTRETIRTAMPDWFFAKIKKAWPAHYMAILASLNERAPMSLRVNPLRSSVSEYLLKLQHQGILAKPSTLANSGLVLEQSCDVGQLPGFLQGTCSVQDEAAQLVTEFLKLHKNQRVLDACCAPGGKTAALLEMCPSSQLFAVDADANRQLRTHENLERLALSATVITADAGRPDQWWDGNEFDHILLDAPCSASGVIRRHPDIRHLRRPEDIDALARLQSKLITQLWPTLKTGGTLLYATCSILPQENTNIIAHLLSNRSDAQVEPLSIKGDIEIEFGSQFLPKTHGHDGFYYCLVRKCLPTKVFKK